MQPSDYPAFLEALKARIHQSRTRAALAVNHELIALYHHIGHAILERQAAAQWGDKILEQLSNDLRHEFPEMKGFSRTNLKYMRMFAEAYPAIGQQVVDQLPWGHIITLLTRIKDELERDHYARAALEFGWSRNILEMHIQSQWVHRQGKALTNFERTLPEPLSDLAQQTLKDPYNFDFLGLGDAAHERDVERGLLEHLKSFMLELGVGFAFVGSQYHLEVASEDFYLDLLFYHLKLRSYVVIELKAGGFKPEYSGKLNFYLSVVDDQLRHPTDASSVGILLCREANRTIVEYALRDIDKPMGVSSYQLAAALPKDLEGVLPTVEQLEAELERLEDEP
jgi:predicted nuclease of restriction endonuclease-like (RecB) superfamily